ncbi:MAG: pyridoxamine 5'-phosphate oxidase family protein [Candidatus Micrarchaeota archaeon]|nr:pyridoxamine 5'-phosphate oxidase family protein [Candidatus Micrarchaeota archaeon]
MERVEELIRQYLDEAKLMQIATTNSGKPWVASVWYVSDSSLNLYFISRRKRRHSLELEQNHNVAGTVVTPHTVGSGEKVRGLQFEGTARECSGDEIKRAKELYLRKYSKAEDIPLEKLQDKSFIAAFYIVSPQSFVLFDEINFPEEPRQEFVIGK